MTKTRKTEGNIQWHEISLFVTLCELLNFLTGIWGRGYNISDISAIAGRRIIINFLKEIAPLKRELKHFQKYNVFYWCRDLFTG